ncbi:hypothetical protein K431DRAFT_343779 [Polychaeton citri CBS 116435]|uniref:Actin binding protein n=1 Tax=Polychaeton citri CBS 116435 TaxID=1314669 RepID=A0A9P4UQD2_9PEZI|nr:hypothetical protein K431DRAFT_343779 [Polychaeton citri CBS 116435]
MATLNTSSNGPSITQSYQKVVNSPPPSGPNASSPTYGQWAVFSVQAPLVSAFQQDSGKESVLKVQATGDGELEDLIEEFSEGRVQFGFVKVKDPNSGLPKNVLIAWCGQGVPERTKGYFTSHLNAVSKLLHGYHVQVTARSDQDLTPDAIVQKVADSSGSKYGGGSTATPSSGPPPPITSKPAMPTKSFGSSGGFQPLGARSRAPQTALGADGDGWGDDAPPVTRTQVEKVESAYQPTKVNIDALRSQNQPSKYQAPPPSNGAPDVVKGGYQPIGKVDIAALRKEAQEKGQLQDERPTTVKGSYEPVGKVDIAAIRSKAQAAPPSKPSPPPQPQEDDDQPKSLADRSAAFTQSERITSLPKPKVANKFGGGSFTGTKAPTPGGFESKPAAPVAAPVGAASRTFADQGGKTPAQLWAEKKARERGASNASESQSSGVGQSTPPIASQPSGGWQSGYAGKKWGVQIPSRTGGSASAVSEQHTGQDESAREEPDEPPSGGIGSIKDRFSGGAPPLPGMAREPTGGAPAPPPLDTTNKPNAGSRGVPIPGLVSHAPKDVPEEQHQDLPPPPPRPIPQDEEEDEEDDNAYQPQGSPPRIAMPIARGPEPAPMESLDQREASVAQTEALSKVISQHQDTEPKTQTEEDEGARAAGQQTAASTFGQAEDTRGAGSSGGREAIAQYDYEKAEDNELELRDGERITNIDMVDDDWWMGQNTKGESGLFPSNYVELLPESETAARAPPPPTASRPVPAPEPEPVAPAAPAAPPAAQAGPTATAQYDYDAAEDNELSFPDGAKITDVISKEFPDDDWWFGHYNGKSGLFPANYVDIDQ